MNHIKKSNLYFDNKEGSYFYYSDSPIKNIGIILVIDGSNNLIFALKEINKYTTIYEEVIDLFNKSDLSLDPCNLVLSNRKIKWFIHK